MFFKFGLGRFFRKIKKIPAKILFLAIKAVNKDKKQKKIWQTIMFIIFWDLMVEQIFLSQQSKRSVIISDKLV